MRIKKSSIIEAVSNNVVSGTNAPINTSNTTSSNTSNTTSTQTTINNKSNSPDIANLEKSKQATKELKGEVDNINKEIEDGPMGAFLSVNENLTAIQKRKVIKTIKIKDLKNG
jgi:hypothetical protein